MNILLPEFKALLKLLNANEVNYMLIGGYAVIYYGYERTTSDMDIWLEPTNANRDRLASALKAFGINAKSLDQLQQTSFEKTQFFFFGEKPRRIDFLTSISGVNWAEATAKAGRFPLEDIEVPIIHYHHLILSKLPLLDTCKLTH